MTICARLARQQLALGSTLVAVLALHTAAGAQELPKIEIVPAMSHSFSITAGAVSPDGTRLLSGSGDKTIKLWDTATGRLLRTFQGHMADVSSVAFSPDGKLILSGARVPDRTLKLWDAASGKLIRSWEAHTLGVAAAAFSPDGAQLVSGGEDETRPGHTLKLWDAASGQLIRVFEVRGARVTSVAFSPDGGRLLSGNDDKALQLWDAASGQLIRTFTGHSGEVKAVAFSPDGTRLLSGGKGKGALKLWDAASGQLIRTFETTGWVNSVAFSPDGARLLTGDGGRAKLWDAASGQLLHTFTGTRGIGLEAVAFSPDGTHLLTRGVALKLWDAATGRLVRTFEPTRPVNSVAFSPDGTHMLSGGADHTVKLWNAASGQLIRTFRGHSDWVTAVAFSPDGARILSGGCCRDHTVKLWDTASGQLVRDFAGHRTSGNAVAFSPDGTRLLSGTYDNTLKLLDAATGQVIRTFEGHTGEVRSGAFSPDGRLLLSSGREGAIESALKLWDTASGQLVHSWQGDRVTVSSVAFSPDGTRLLSGSGFGTLKLWDAASRQQIRVFEGHPGGVSSVAFSPDGARLLSGGRDNAVALWDASTGQRIRSFAGHLGSVNSVAFSPDTTRILSGSSDGSIRIWSAEAGQHLASVIGSPDGEWLVITPEGFFDASANGAQVLSIVRGAEVYSIDQFYQTLYRPDLVREKLAGDPNGKVREAAARLDLGKLLDSGRVPNVAVTSHKAQDASSVDLVTLEAQLADQGGGIGRAEWRINGITVGVVEKAGAAAGQPIALKQAMALDPGENTIELVAYNGANLVASVPARARITWTGTEPTAPPRLYVLVVGINDYLDTALKLTYAVPDAKTLAAALKQAGQGHYEDVIVTQVLDRNATAAKLDEAFKELAAKVRPRDVFLFFAAGHGKTLDGRYYFIPHDLRYHTDQSLVREAIGQDRLQAWFARILAKKAVLMFDTCEAGSLTERGKTRGGLEQKAAVGRLIQATGRATLTASSATQEAYEGHGGHGVFTFALLDALARGDTSSNGLIELAELIQHVDGLVPAITEKRWGARQFPQMDAYGANFSLARQVAALAPAQDDAIIIPIKPTHVSTELLQIFKAAGGSGGIIQQLPPFTTVTAVRSERGWVLIARDGRALGYVAEGKLHKLN